MSRKLAFALIPILIACEEGSRPPPNTGDNRAPTAPSVLIAPANPSSADALVAMAAGSTDPDGDAVTLKYAWFEGATAQDDLRTDTVPAARTRRGQTWRVKVTPSDGKLDGAAGEAMVTIRNAPPVAAVSLAPAMPGDDDELVATATATDPDGDRVTLSYAWRVDTAMSPRTGPTIPALDTAQGQRWTVTVTASDGTDSSAPAMASVTIGGGNRAPTIGTLAIVPPRGDISTTFACTPQNAVDRDGDPILFRYAWFVNGAAATSSSALAAPAFARGDTIRCEATPSDGMVDGPLAMSAPVIVGNAKPSLASARIAPATPVEADRVTASLGATVDPEGDAVTVQYEWRVNGTLVATSSTIDGRVFNKGDNILLTAFPHDGMDRGTGVASNIAVGANTPPTVAGVSILPSPAGTADDLRAMPMGAMDVDPADAVIFDFAWTINGMPANLNAGVLPAARTRRGDAIGLRITPRDRDAAGRPVDAAPIIIGNTPPSTPVVVTGPANADIRSALTCRIGTPSMDPDGDAISYRYAWLRDGMPSTQTSSVVAAGVAGGRETWTCLVTPSDGMADGTPGSSDVYVADRCDSVELNGTSAYVSAGASSAFAYGSAATVEAWVSWDGMSGFGFDEAIFTHRPGSNAMSIGVFGNDTSECACPGRATGQPYFRWGTDCAERICIRGPTRLAANRWTHVAGVWDNGTARLFIDGQIVATTTAAAAIETVSAASSVGIGALANGAGAFFGGTIGEVRVSTAARYSASFMPPVRLSSAGPSIAHWQLDEGTGGTSADASGNGHTASLSGGARWTQSGPSCGLDVAQLASRYATAFCGHRTRCEPAFYSFFGENQASCIASTQTANATYWGGLADALDAQRILFDAQRFESCVAAFASADCERGLDDNACAFLVGQRTLGQSCGINTECATGLYCTATAFGMCGQCARRVPAQQSCATAPCLESLDCLDVGGTPLCITFSADVGQTCGTVATGLCRGRLICTGSGTLSCRRPAQPGAACDDTATTLPACNIYQDQVCVGGRCTMVRWGPAGSQCLGADQCNSTATCNQGTSRCEALPAAGQPCGANGACAAGTYCDGARCQVDRAQGTMCTSDAQCGTNLVCLSGTCRPYAWTRCP